MRGAGLPEVRTSGLQSPSGAPHVAQNLVPDCTAEPQRAQAGPEPGAVSRRPQLGQNGSSSLVGPPQKGHGPGSAREEGAGPATWVAGMFDAWRGGPAALPPPPPSAALVRLATAPAAVSGLPQSMQNCALASLARPQ
ncbi:MAG: hypothetical protein AUH78_00015 [Gemmatimonadetes bacterium 13_1_40CM_4_69_8]|nr:MAG: hypothetical protein AUH78_00015 [Gemmatimonadetes bacterium 13_1_40CM_4_69_8]